MEVGGRRSGVGDRGSGDRGSSTPGTRSVRVLGASMAWPDSARSGQAAGWPRAAVPRRPSSKGSTVGAQPRVEPVEGACLSLGRGRAGRGCDDVEWSSHGRVPWDDHDRRRRAPGTQRDVRHPREDRGMGPGGAHGPLRSRARGRRSGRCGRPPRRLLPPSWAPTRRWPARSSWRADRRLARIVASWSFYGLRLQPRRSPGA